METGNRNVATAAKRAALTALGGSLRIARTNAGLTQQAVAERLQVSAQTVRNWEAGRHEPAAQMIDALASMYGIPTEHLRKQGPRIRPEDLDPYPNRRVAVVPHLLRETREDAGMTQAQAARHSGVGLSSIRRYEQGTARPTGAVLRRLALVYGKPQHWFNSGKDGNAAAAESHDVDEVMAAYALAQPDLTARSKATIADFIRFTYQQQIKRNQECDACAWAEQMAS